MTRRDRRTVLVGLAFVSPWLVGFVAFTAVPIGLSIYYSVCDYSLLQPPVYVGAANYRGLAADPVFWLAVRNTLGYAAVALPAGLVVALGLAMLLNVKTGGQAVYRTLIFLPSLVPTVAAALLWMWILNAKLGLLNVLLRKVGVADPPGWLTERGVDQAGDRADRPVGRREHGRRVPGRVAGRAAGAVRGGRDRRGRRRRPDAPRHAAGPLARDFLQLVMG